MKKLTLSGVMVLAGVLLFSTVSAATHTLVVNGNDYQSYKVSGDAWHFETPAGVVPASASVPERSQTWTGNGSDKLPCPYGIHWISNENVLTISHCLDDPYQTTTTTTEPEETTSTTTTEPSTTSSTTTTTTSTTSTVPETTSTTTTTEPGTTTTIPDTSSSTTTTPSELSQTTTSTVAVGQPPVPVQPTPDTPVVLPVTPTALPSTGAEDPSWWVKRAALLVAAGASLVLVTRRKPSTLG